MVVHELAADTNGVNELTFARYSSTKVVTELEGVLDGDAGGVPHLLKLGQWLELPDTHHKLAVVEVGSVVFQEAQPQLSCALAVPAQTVGPGLLQADWVVKEPRVPPVNHPHRSVTRRVQFLQVSGTDAMRTQNKVNVHSQINIPEEQVSLVDFSAVGNG